MQKVVQHIQFYCIQSLIVFGAWEGFLFEFACLSGVWKFENKICWARPICQWPISILTARDSDSFPFWLPGRRRPTWVGPPYPCSGRHRGSRHPRRFALASFGPTSSLLCSELVAASPTVARRRWATSKLSDRVSWPKAEGLGQELGQGPWGHCGPGWVEARVNSRCCQFLLGLLEI
jgi:hypothetical protein